LPKALFNALRQFWTAPGVYTRPAPCAALAAVMHWVSWYDWHAAWVNSLPTLCWQTCETPQTAFA
jgi:hypothetical protein